MQRAMHSRWDTFYRADCVPANCKLFPTELNGLFIVSIDWITSAEHKGQNQFDAVCVFHCLPCMRSAVVDACSATICAYNSRQQCKSRKRANDFIGRLTHLAVVCVHIMGRSRPYVMQAKSKRIILVAKTCCSHVAFALRKAQHPKPLDSLRSLHKCSAYENSIHSLGYMVYRRVYYAIDLDPLTMECCANNSMRRVCVCVCLSSVQGFYVSNWIFLHGCYSLIAQRLWSTKQKSSALGEHRKAHTARQPPNGLREWPGTCGDAICAAVVGV